MKVTRILHHSVNVGGAVEPMVEFYRSLFSLEDANRPEIPGVGGHWLTVGDAQIHLVDAPPRGAGGQAAFEGAVAVWWRGESPPSGAKATLGRGGSQAVYVLAREPLRTRTERGLRRC